MNTITRLFAVLLSLTGFMFAVPTAHADNACSVGYHVGFFNGVGNTELEAINGRLALQAAVRYITANADDTYHQEKITYELYYNHTGSSVGASAAQDVAEVFIQRANEIDPSGFFSANNFYLLWESLTGTPRYGDVAYSGPVANFATTFINSTITSLAASVSSVVSSPPTASDIATHNATLDSVVAAGRKMLLIAHSQGNLFVNQGYDHIFPTVGSTRVKAVHVAPASPTIRGPYLLSSNDIIINLLRLNGGDNSVQANNITIPFSATEKSGHFLIETYLDATRIGYGATTTMISGALSALAPPTCNPTLTPATNNPIPGANVTLTATLPAPTADGAVGLGYVWKITGNANGAFSGANGLVTTINTTTPSVTYVASNNAASPQSDTVTVTAYATKDVGNLQQSEQLGTATATISPNSNPWIGTWVGSTNSTCGRFSGALTLVITSTGVNLLHLAFGLPDGSAGGGYGLIIDPTNPLRATLNGNKVVDTLSGPNLTTLTSIEDDACQYGQFFKQ